MKLVFLNYEIIFLNSQGASTVTNPKRFGFVASKRQKSETTKRRSRTAAGHSNLVPPILCTPIEARRSPLKGFDAV